MKSVSQTSASSKRPRLVSSVSSDQHVGKRSSLKGDEKHDNHPFERHWVERVAASVLDRIGSTIWLYLPKTGAKAHWVMWHVFLTDLALGSRACV